jgi:hypothetical protein
MKSSYNQIEDFLDGNLIGKELSLFISQKEIDKELSKEIEFRAEVNELIKDKGFFELIEKLELQMNESYMSSSLIKFRRDLFKTWHFAAASFALILVVGGLWYILSNKPYSTEKLVSKYYKPAHPLLQVRSAEIKNDDALVTAFKYYKDNDFTNALTYFNSLEHQITAKFYSGVCLIELEKYNQAIESFITVINDNDNLFVEQANWYLGLIYLMDNQKNRAIEQFEKISKDNNYYSAQAKEILKYLN